MKDLERQFVRNTEKNMLIREAKLSKQSWIPYQISRLLPKVVHFFVALDQSLEEFEAHT
jgi:hypothetical protein